MIHKSVGRGICTAWQSVQKVNFKNPILVFYIILNKTFFQLNLGTLSLL